jgi:hypothetical protein
LKNFGVAHHQQENAGTQIKEGEDLEKKTRRIASKLHIMASKKQLDPAVRGFLFITIFLRAHLITCSSLFLYAESFG